MPVFCNNKSRYKLVVYLKNGTSKYISEKGTPKIVEYSPIRKTSRSELMRIYKRAKHYREQANSNAILLYDNVNKNLIEKIL